MISASWQELLGLSDPAQEPTISTAGAKRGQWHNRYLTLCFSCHTCWILIVWQLPHQDRVGLDRA